MREFAIRVLINAVGIAITAFLLPGITISDSGLGTLLIVGIIFGLVNSVIKPIITLLTCPFVIITLGLFILVINGCMLALTAQFAGDRLNIEDPQLLWAIIGGIVMAIIGMILESVLGIRDEDNERQKRSDAIRENRQV